MRRYRSLETEEQRKTRLAKLREHIAYRRSNKICQKRAENLAKESPTLCNKQLADDSELCVGRQARDEMTGCNEHLTVESKHNGVSCHGSDHDAEYEAPKDINLNNECEVLVKYEIKDEIEISEDPLLEEITNTPSIDNFQ
ncbi:unnamed protein product [Colias eurytheme]|nr:unnamed protein product [Colias eurytheme]